MRPVTKIAAFVLLATSMLAAQGVAGDPEVGEPVGSSSAVPALVTDSYTPDTSPATSTVATSVVITAQTTLLIADLMWNDSTPRTASVATSAGVSCTWNTVTAKLNVASNDPARQAFYCTISGTGSTTATLTLSGTSGFKAIHLMAFSGVTSTSPLDQVASASAVSGTSCATGPTGTLAVTGELVFASCSSWNTLQTWPAVTGYTQIPASQTQVGYYAVASSTAAQSLTATGLNSDIWVAIIATFKPQ